MQRRLNTVRTVSEQIDTDSIMENVLQAARLIFNDNCQWAVDYASLINWNIKNLIQWVWNKSENLFS